MTDPAALAYTESGSGLPVVLLHAFPLSAQMWYGMRGHGRGGYRLVTPDLPGFGRSPLPDVQVEPSLDTVAVEVLALLDRLDLDRVVLGGVSMGGYVSMAVLRQAPQRVRALVLADTKATADTDIARANRSRIADTAVAEGSARVVLDDVVPGLLGTTTHEARPDVVAAVRALAAGANPASIAWAQRAMAARPDSINDLRAFDGPALVIVGDEDGVTPPAEAESMAAALPHARLVRLPRAGHLAAVETPAAFAESLGTFIASL